MEQLPNKEISRLVNDLYSVCRSHVELYDSPSGIKIEYEGEEWAVVYWPAYEDKADSLSFMKDWQKLDHPVSYRVEHDGTVTKNSSIASRSAGGVYFNPAGREPVDEIDEVQKLKILVDQVHSSTK